MQAHKESTIEAECERIDKQKWISLAEEIMMRMRAIKDQNDGVAENLCELSEEFFNPLAAKSVLPLGVLQRIQPGI